jgi:hypothetical protein
MPTEVGGHIAPTPAVHGHDGYRAHTTGSDAYEEGEASISEGPNVALLRSRHNHEFAHCLDCKVALGYTRPNSISRPADAVQDFRRPSSRPIYLGLRRGDAYISTPSLS